MDVETTGFSPRKGDHVIGLAIARVDKNGRIENEYATLLNLEARDSGAVLVHGISNDSVRDAPLFADVVADVLARLMEPSWSHTTQGSKNDSSLQSLHGLA